MAGYNKLFEFESKLSEFTGAPYVVATDCCTHAIELCMRYSRVGYCEFPCNTYLSIPQLLKRLGITYYMYDVEWAGEYQFQNTNIWDSARMLEKNMYRAGQMQCLSFGPTKPLHLGRVGAILLDDKDAYHTLSMWRSDGRDLHISPWEEQKQFEIGFHYTPSLELCEKGLAELDGFSGATTTHTYPDLTRLKIEFY